MRRSDHAYKPTHFPFRSSQHHAVRVGKPNHALRHTLPSVARRLELGTLVAGLMYHNRPSDNALDGDHKVNVGIPRIAVLPRGDVPKVAPVPRLIGRKAMLHRDAVRICKVAAGELAVVAPHVAVRVDMEPVRPLSEFLHDGAYNNTALAAAAALAPPLGIELNDAGGGRTVRSATETAYQSRLCHAA